MHERLKLAKKYLAIAESKDSKREAYKRASTEVVKHKDETGETDDVIAITLGRERSYVTLLRKWHREDFKGETPFLMDERATERAAISHTKKVLAQAPMEQVERIISELPKTRQRAIGAAAGDEYMKIRQESEERETRLTPEERRQRERAGDDLTRPLKQAVAGFDALGIAQHIEQATEMLQDLTADGSLTTTTLRQIDKADKAWREAVEFARQLVA